jgi:cell division protein FtsN
MAPLQQQRLIGLILLLIIISSMSLFLLSKVNRNNPVEDTSEPVIFDSIVEPLADQEIEVIDPIEEVRVVVAEPEIKTPVAPMLDTPIPTKALKSAASVELPKKVELAPIKSESSFDDEMPQWFIQVGSFSVKANATQVSQRLEAQGLSPVIKTSQSNGKTIYRVQLPPSSDKSALKKTAAELARTLNLTPRILQL